MDSVRNVRSGFALKREACAVIRVCHSSTTAAKFDFDDDCALLTAIWL